MNKLFVVLFFFSFILTDLHTKNYVGSIARSPIFVVAPIFFLILLVRCRISLKGITKGAFIYVIITFVASFVFLVYNIIVSQNYYVYDSDIVIKFFKAFGNVLLIFIVAVDLYYLMRVVGFDFFIICLKYSYLFLLLVFFVEWFSPDLLSDVYLRTEVLTHGGDYGRFRLLSSEPSHAAFVFNVISLMVYKVEENVYMRFGVLVMIAFVGLVISSKAAIILLPFVLFVGYMRFDKRGVFICVLFCIVLLYVYPVWMDLMTVDIERYNSFSTRFSGIVAAISSIVSYPLGMGYGTYLMYYPDVLYRSYAYINEVFYLISGQPLNGWEIFRQIDTGRSLEGKSQISQEVIYNGVVALIFYGWVIRKTMVMSQKRNELKMILMYVFLSMAFFVDTGALFVAWLPVMMIEYMADNEYR